MSQPTDKKPPAGGRKKPMGLGRGLAALLGDDDFSPSAPVSEPRPGEKVLQLPLERLSPNPYQPRRVYEPSALKALADSIKEHGVLQPLVVRPAQEGYQIIAGERRHRASHMAGLATVPAVVREATDEQALVLALLENLQREDLGPLEEARGYAQLAEEFELSQEEIAKLVGKDRSTVANSLRLLKLPDAIQNDLNQCLLSAGHARAMLALASEALMRKARDQVLKKGLSVRATERLVKSLGKDPAVARTPTEEETYLKSLAEELARQLGAKVEITKKGKKGRLTVEFYSNQGLETLLELLRAKD